MARMRPHRLLRLSAWARHRDRNCYEDNNVPDEDQAAEHDTGNGMAGAVGAGILARGAQSQNAEAECDRAEDEADTGDQSEYAAIISRQRPAVLVRDKHRDAVIVLLIARPSAPPARFFFRVFLRSRPAQPVLVVRSRLARPLLAVRSRAASRPATVFLERFVIGFGHGGNLVPNAALGHRCYQTACPRRCQWKSADSS